MAGGGYYPIMTDAEWDSAPWNEPCSRVCPKCDGIALWYCDINDNEISLEQYARLTDEEKENWCLTRCTECDGTGEVYD